MPFSFIEIEERKSRSIWLVFLAVVAFYFLTAYLCILIFRFTSGLSYWISRPGSAAPFGIFLPFHLAATVFIAAACAALVQWLFVTSNLIQRLCLAMECRELDPSDAYHQTLKNIVEEVSVATGKSGIEARVVPSSALNAFALQDFEGRAVIGVTEGLLASLNRSHIEAVVAHEAAHIAGGDALLATVVSAISELYAQVLHGLSRGMRGRSKNGLAIALIILVLAVMRWLTNLLHAFISREREYRADAVAVRLTRNPLSLAEALKMITARWHGAGGASDRLESIYIVNPRFSEFDEQTSFFADLFSTHPPVKSRIGILLGMAHLDEASLEANLGNFKRVSPVAEARAVVEPPEPGRWSVFDFDRQTWLGPMGSDEVRNLKFIRPDTWVRREKSEKAVPLYEETELRQAFSRETVAGAVCCPYCRLPLTEISYEGTRFLQCQYCLGSLVERSKIMQILIRQDMTFSQEIRLLGRKAVEEMKTIRLNQTDGKSVWGMECPKCGEKMLRQFFVLSYPVLVDQCQACSLVWFDKTELEILQFIYEDRAQSSR